MTEQPIRLLAVEDNPADWRLIQGHLELLGADQIDHCPTLRDAVQHLEQHPVDILLLDLNLPDTLGLAGLDHLQRQYPDLPIVVLTGFAADDLMVAREALRFGAQDFLSKTSLDAEALQRSLILAIERKRAERQRARAAVEDELTSLPRARSLSETFGRAVARAARSDRKVAIIAIGIDHLRRVAMHDGSDRADELVRVMADRLRRVLRGQDCLTRTESGCFIALLGELKNKSDIYDIARRLVEIGRKPLPELALSQRITLSVGMAMVNLADDTFENARETAERALQQAMDDGGERFVAADETPAPAPVPTRKSSTRPKAGARTKAAATAEA